MARGPAPVNARVPDRVENRDVTVIFTNAAIMAPCEFAPRKEAPIM